MLTSVKHFFSFWLVAKALDYAKINTIDILSDFPLAVEVIAFLVVYDFLMYWTHRLKHSSDVFWIFHRFHHTPNVMSVFSFNRNHILDWSYRTLLVKLPVVYFFGTDVYNLVLVTAFVTVSACLNHSELDTDYGFLGKIFASPRFHLIHHSRRHLDKNYGIIFSFWDILFGTYREVNTIKDLNYGIEDDLYSKNHFVKAYFLEFIEFFRALRIKLRFKKN